MLFNGMLIHSCVPEALGQGIVVPIIKDKNKNSDSTSLDNYRPITLSPVISKLFKMYMLEKYSKHFNIDPLQFAFKSTIGCRDAIFVVRQIGDYFTSRGSNLYVASLDASKAFDRINHYKMLSTLLKMDSLRHFVLLMQDW